MISDVESSLFARALLVAGGPLPFAQAELLRAEIATRHETDGLQTALVGVDGGAAHLVSLQVRPDFVTGDFDSLPVALRETLAAQGARIVPTPDQDYTDLDKALTFARDTLGAGDIQIWAATGGRIDHAYSVLSAVLKHGRGPNAPHIRLCDEWGETRPVPAEGVHLQGADLPGRILSLITLGIVAGITTTGVEWPLESETLAPGVRDGTLNRITSETVTVSHQSGDSLLFIGRITPPPPLPEAERGD